MTATSTTSSLRYLTVEDLKGLARYTGPCLTIQIPGHRPGSAAPTRLANLRQLTHAAVEGLRKISRPDEAADVAAALENLTQNLALENGGPGITLFCAPHFDAAYITPGVTKEEVMIGSHFHLVPQLSAALSLQEFCVLGISRNHMRLFRYEYGACEELPWPANLPRSLKDAGDFDKPDHTQESRTPVGPSMGNMRNMRFGTSSDHDSQAEYIRHFFEQVDKGLKATLRGAALFLAGVQEEVSLYRKVAKHTQILGAECHGNIDHATPDDVARHAGAAVAREYRAATELALSALPGSSEKLYGDPELVLKAAQAGRIRQLFVAEDAHVARAHVNGVFVGEDMLNAAAVEALRTGARIFVIPGNDIPGYGPIAAIVRY